MSIYAASALMKATDKLWLRLLLSTLVLAVTLISDKQLLAQTSTSAVVDANAKQWQQSTVSKSGKYPTTMNPMDMVNMPSVGLLFLETKSFSTSISIVNAATAPVTAMLVLRALDGTTLLKKPVTVGGHSAVSLKVGDVLTSVGSQVQQGRVELYDDSVEGSALAGQLTLNYTDRARVHTIDEELTMPNMATSHTLRGVVVDSTGVPFVAVTNPGMQSEDVTANCYPENASSEELHFTIQPEGTALLHGCRLLKGELDADWLSKSPASPIQGSVYAMELAAVTPHGEIEAFGLAPDTVNGISEWTSVNFFDPAKLNSSTTIFAGIPMGNTPLLWGTYTPRLAVHNFGLRSQKVDVRLASTNSGFATTAIVETLTLQPNESRSLDVPQTAVSNNELLNTLTVEGSDAGGGIVAQLLIEDRKQDVRTQLIGKSGADDTNMGMHPWNLSSGEDDELLLYNQTGSAQHAYLKIGNGQSVWEKTETLGSWATQRIRISDLIASHAKDDHGKELLLGDGYGEVSWSADGQSLLKGRLLRLNNTTHSATSFQCAAYEVICDGIINGPTSMTGGQYGSWSASAFGCINTYASNYCSGSHGGSKYPSGYQWSVSGIQTTDSLTSSFVSGTATGGNVLLNVNMTDGNCEASASSTVTVSGYAPATVTSISPSIWTAGQSYPGVQITGTNFGGTPTVSLSDPTIQVLRQPYNTSNSNGTWTTRIDLKVPQSTPSEPVTVTLTPGSGGSSFSQAPGGPSLPGSNTAAVIGLQQSACPAMLDSDGHDGFSNIASTGLAVGGSGSMNVSFSRGSFNGYSVTVPYGPYSTPESIAAHIAALITKNYYNLGLSAQAIGAQILYKGTMPFGIANFTTSGSSYTADPSPQSCPKLNFEYVLAVTGDSVSPWVSNLDQRGREVKYTLKLRPSSAQQTNHTISVLKPSFTTAVITEHLYNSTALAERRCTFYTTYPECTSSNANYPGGPDLGIFADIIGLKGLGSINLSGRDTKSRWFDVVITNTDLSQTNLGWVPSYDKTGKNVSDRLLIIAPNGPSIVNDYQNPDGLPKSLVVGFGPN